jgi:broad specificity phosphatase PhoE
LTRSRTLGTASGPFDLVLISISPRTLETAIAMGFAVDDQLQALGDIPAEVVDEIGHQERWSWEAPFVRFAQVVAHGGATAQMGRRQYQAWVQAVESLPPHGQVLVISHGRVIEAGLVTCFPDGAFAAWGAPFQHCEGVRLQYAASRFTEVHFLRLA